MKKTIKPFTPLIVMLLMIAIGGVGGIILVTEFTRLFLIKSVDLASYIFVILIGLFSLIITIFAIVGFCRNKIIIDDEKMQVTRFLYPKGSIPYEDIIYYSEIQNIKLVYVKFYIRGRFNRITMFEIYSNKGKKQLFFVQDYASWQRRQLIDIINSKTGLNFNYKLIEKEFEILELE
jgi:hypothetical protein